jgi:hypothetical protein
VQLAFLSFIHRSLEDFASKVAFVFVTTATAWAIKSSRLPCIKVFLLLQTLASPLTAALSLFAAALSAPLVPVFGLPFFLVGFPRPLRTAEDLQPSKSDAKDHIYYEQAEKQLRNFVQQVERGAEQTHRCSLISSSASRRSSRVPLATCGRAPPF